MAVAKTAAGPKGGQDIVWNPGDVNPKQKQFLQAKTLFTCYGGAKGGGKTHILRIKAVGGALAHPGIRILIMRRTYAELESNHIRPILKMVNPGYCSYNGAQYILTFYNGSTIKFGHWSGDNSEQEYNGQEFDWIFIDEATQFTERTFNFLGGCLRGATDIPRRMYLTCNPGGVGHNWVKRLFIDKHYLTGHDNPEEDEHPEDYTMIFATVEDNVHMLKNSPNYLKTLASMPADVRDAYRFGKWDVVGGNYFKEFSRETHTMPSFQIPRAWTKYRSFDYGLDLLAVGWWAVDTDGRCWCFREYEEERLIVKDAAAAILDHTLPGEQITVTYAPPDMWGTMKDTGKTMAETFMVNGVDIVRSGNNRVQGHMMLKNMMSPMPLRDPFVIKLFPEGKAPSMLPGIMIFDKLERLISDLESIQADDANPNDCAKQPHELTHTVDMCRYFAINRVIAAEKEQAKVVEEDEDEKEQDYQDFMCGGEANAEYMAY